MKQTPYGTECQTIVINNHHAEIHYHYYCTCYHALCSNYQNGSQGEHKATLILLLTTFAEILEKMDFSTWLSAIM